MTFFALISKKKNVIIISFVTICIILITRLFSLTYNMYLHPDEVVFFSSTNSLMNSIIHSNEEFKEFKEYPEGTYLFQLPFFLVGKVFSRIVQIDFSPHLWGRISSVCYFSIAVLIGIKILYLYFGASIVSIVIYALTMSFSLFFLEHSRYGTGDMISLFLLLLCFDATAYAVGPHGSLKHFIISSFLCGALASIKYPLIIFLTIPISSYIFHNKHFKVRKYIILILLLISFGGFLVFSPKSMVDLNYIYRVLLIESKAYITQGSEFEGGGFLNHAASVTLYSLLYSDFPASFLFVVFSFNKSLKKLHHLNKVDSRTFLFDIVIPCVCILFFCYNIFARILFFRTYTPFFTITSLYCASAAGSLFENGKMGRNTIIFLCTFMIIRGATMTWFMSSEDKIHAHFSSMVKETVDSTWKQTILITPYTLDFDSELQEQADIKQYNLNEYIEFCGDELPIEAGTLVIAGAYEFGRTHSYIFPASGSAALQVELWNSFKYANKSFYRGQSYPDEIYYFWGGWLRGGTLSHYVFPCNFIYYHS